MNTCFLWREKEKTQNKICKKKYANGKIYEGVNGFDMTRSLT